VAKGLYFARSVALGPNPEVKDQGSPLFQQRRAHWLDGGSGGFRTHETLRGVWTPKRLPRGNDIYDRLAPGVKSALHERVRRNASGRPTQKLTQLLTVEEGKPRLRELLEGVKLLMRMSDDWQTFMGKLDEFYPKVGDTLQLPLRGGIARISGPKETPPTDASFPPNIKRRK
jgi:hypothetical protein